MARGDLPMILEGGSISYVSHYQSRLGFSGWATRCRCSYSVSPVDGLHACPLRFNSAQGPVTWREEVCGVGVDDYLVSACRNGTYSCLCLYGVEIHT